MTTDTNTQDDMRTRIRQFLSTNFQAPAGGELLHDDDSLLEKGVIDSTGALELVLFIEEAFDIEVDDDDVIPENLDSIDNLVRFVQGKTTDAHQ